MNCNYIVAMKLLIPTACYSLRQVVMEALGQKNTSELTVDGADNDSIILTLEKFDFKEATRTLEKALLANHLDHDYAIIEHDHYQYDIAILKKVDIEQLGVYVCGICGIILQSEYERDSHQTLDHKSGRFGGF